MSQSKRVRRRAAKSRSKRVKRILLSLAGMGILYILKGALAFTAIFGLHSLDIAFTAEDGSAVTQAGSHPHVQSAALAVDTENDEVLELEVPIEDFRDLTVIFPPGLVADRDATPHCLTADFGLGNPKCPSSTMVGTGDIEIEGLGKFTHVQVFNLVAPSGAVAKLGFAVLGVPVSFELGLSQDPPYEGIARQRGVPQVYPFYSAKLQIWGTPAAKAHDAERGGPAGAAELPFLTLPRSCTGPLPITFKATSWEGSAFEQTIETHGDGLEPLGMTGCSKLDFSPAISALPTNRSAESPTGLDFDLDVADEGLLNPTGIAQSDIKKIVVALPKGVTANPSQAEGLGVCSEEELEEETIDSEPGEGCPQSSKIGTIEVESPLAKGEILKGALYVATPNENRFGTLIAFYVVIKSRDLGIIVKQAAKVEPDPITGQLVTTTEDMPQLPFGHFHLHFREGGRSPLITPPQCGTYETKAEFTPWANPSSTYTTTASFKVDSGVGGGPCPPAGTPPFKPGFTAGTLNNAAGAHSPFYMRLTRRDGDQDMTKFSSILPPGVSGKIAGIAKCPDAAIAAAKANTATQELASPSCRASSEIGHTLAGAGVGSELTYVPGKLYLGGPVAGDPLSVVSITPAKAGPFDAGTVVVRVALTVNPRTGVVEVDGANSDPIPHILKGIVLKVRDLRVYADRPNFTLNPTSCTPSEARATLFGSFADVFNPADDVPVSLSSRFQAADCARLPFKPKLAMSLKGGTHRGDHPAFKATLSPRAGDANFSRIAVTLPRSAFLDQAHIRTICTRVQYAAHACPQGSIYGKATVTTPLLDEALSGPVYLRSSNHNLPDLVLSLHGLLDIELVGRIDSHKGGIRTTFEEIPDAPASKAVLEMQGGKKGLIVNSRNLCANRSPATAKLIGQNGRPDDFRPVVRALGC